MANQDITDVVAGSYGQPFGSLCLQVLGQKAGLAMFSLNIIARESSLTQLPGRPASLLSRD